MVSTALTRKPLSFPPPLPSHPGIYIGRKIKTLNGRHYDADQPTYYEGELHQLLFGPSGVGKGLRLQAPNLLTVFGKSMVVIDPKGQLAAITALYRQHRGDEVHIIDPFGVLQSHYDRRPDLFWPLAQAGLLKSAGFNPLAHLAALPAGKLYGEVRSIAQAMIPADSTTDPFWGLAARALFTGITMHEVMEKGRRANLSNVYNTLTMADQDILLPDGGTYHQSFSKFVQLILNEEVKRDPKQQVKADKDYARAMETVKNLLGRFGSGRANETIDSVRLTTEAFTEWLNNGDLAADLQRGEIDMSRLKHGARPVTIYVIMPSNEVLEYPTWLRLVVNAAIRACTAPGRGRDVVLLMDEFPALGYMEIVERMWGVARDYGLIFWAAMQNFSQMTKLYDRYETMLSSTGVIQSFRVGDPTTADVVSKLGGNRTVVKLGFNLGNSLGDKGHHNVSSGQSKEQIALPWIPEHFLRDLAPDKTVVAFSGHSRVSILHVPHLYTHWRMAELETCALRNPYRP